MLAVRETLWKSLVPFRCFGSGFIIETSPAGTPIFLVTSNGISSWSHTRVLLVLRRRVVASSPICRNSTFWHKIDLRGLSTPIQKFKKVLFYLPSWVKEARLFGWLLVAGLLVPKRGEVRPTAFACSADLKWLEFIMIYRPEGALQYIIFHNQGGKLPPPSDMASVGQEQPFYRGP